MSTAIEFDNVAKVIPPLWDFESEQKFKYRQGAANVAMRTFTSSGSSSSQLIFNNIQLPSPTSIWDPRVFIETQFSLNMAVTNGANTNLTDAVFAQNVLSWLSRNVCSRYMPISQSATNITVEIGDGSFNSKPQDYIHALGHYSDCYNMSEREISVAPAFMDRTSTYSVVSTAPVGSPFNFAARSPFQQYTENPYVVPRSGYNGGFKLSISTPLSGSSTALQPFTAYITVCEPLFVSPLAYGDEIRGLTNFSNCNIIVSLSNQIQRVFSALAVDGNGIPTIPVITFTGAAAATTYSDVAFPGAIGPADAGATKLYCTYATAKTEIPQVLHYPHNPITSYKKSSISTDATLKYTGTSDSVQLSSVPKRLYVFVEPATKTATTPDTFASITQVNLFVGNGPSMLSQADQKQLYLMSERNGCQLSWSEWSNPQLAGSVLCIDFARDCGLDLDWFVGKGGPITAYFTINGFGSSAGQALNMWAIYVFDGYLTITRGGSVVAYNSVFAPSQSEKELMDADFMPWVVNPDAMYYGGASMREIGSKIVSVVKGKVIPSARWVASQIMKHPDQAKAIADTVLGIIPYGAELENFVRTVMSFLPAELKERAANALRGSGKMLEQGPAGGTFSGGALAKSGIRKASMMDLCRK